MGGISGPILFVTMVILCGWLRPDYSHLNQYISELGETEGSLSLLMNILGFIPSGLMFIAFSFSLFSYFPKSFSSLMGSLLMAAFGVGMVTAGVYSCDPGCSTANLSYEGMMHGQAAKIGFLSGIASILVWSLVFRRLDFWKSFWRYSLVLGCAAFVFLMMTYYSAELRLWTGVWQRLCLGLIFVWCLVVSRNMLISD